MVGSGIASASRKPAGSRGSWLKRGRAGYLSPRHLCTNDIQYSVRQEVRSDACNPGAGKHRTAKGTPVGRLVHVANAR